MSAAAADTITRPSLTLRRRIAASPEKIFEAWTNKLTIARWWGCPETRSVPVVEIDVRVGGTFRVALRTEDGATHVMHGTYREVVPARRLVFTWHQAMFGDAESVVTVSLRPDGDGTWLTLTHEQFADDSMRDAHAYGWTGSLDRLVAQFG
jgi:uncharacterized protein YndB with AHSA1/START domain